MEAQIKWCLELRTLGYILPWLATKHRVVERMNHGRHLEGTDALLHRGWREGPMVQCTLQVSRLLWQYSKGAEGVLMDEALQ